MQFEIAVLALIVGAAVVIGLIRFFVGRNY
jgi:hypothetical protein